ncbi:MAG: type IV secretory system conjugative DNA transfer family protein [Roseibium sp.]|uniref:type IV secretory system conjugative DNA transfer family protein n=1 Tax=Roseibium polysiphoniae TaxID=2571221 RepID=UPI003299D583
MRLSYPKSHVINGCAALCGVSILTCLLIDPGFAQSWGRHPWIPDTTHWRVLTMVMGGAGGFVLGWFFSPYAREFRNFLFFSGGVTITLFAVIDNGVTGWSLAVLASIIFFGLGLGFWLALAAKAFAQRPTTFGSARWATRHELECHGLIGSGGIHLGDYVDHEGIASLEYCGDRHLVTQGMTRSGKGATIIVPYLLTYDGSMLVIDPKGENALITAKHREDALGQRVHIVDP